MRINRFRPTRGQAALGLSFLLWSLYWGTVTWRAILTSTELGQGTGGAGLAGHKLFEVAFTAAHGGIRWLAGVSLIALAWGVSRIRRRRRARHAA